MARRKQQSYIKGSFSHRRTESDYMGTLLDVVTLEDWRQIVASTVSAAKSGDPSARTFLAQYLVGRPELKAPAPVTVVVQQLSGRDPVVEKLAHPHIERIKYPSLNGDEGWKDSMKALIADELQALEAQKSIRRKTPQTLKVQGFRLKLRLLERAGSPNDYGKICWEGGWAGRVAAIAVTTAANPRRTITARWTCAAGRALAC
ncbi:MAG: hypothetical protein ACRETF_05000 [Nevskiaceae bacterium]